MRKFHFTIILLILCGFVFSQTEGELTVSFVTSDAEGPYRPSHVLAVWIEDEQGNFVKTLKVYASIYIFYLNTWRASTVAAGKPFNTVDAVTGPTVINHTLRSSTWNGTDYNRDLVPDGIYKLRMELTDKNETGNYSTFMFEKNDNYSSLNPDDVPSFSDISIVWQAQNNSVSNNKNNHKPTVYPNPNYGIININTDKEYYAELRNIRGQLIISEKTSLIDITKHPTGIYLLKLSAENEIYYYKVLKRD